MRNADLLPNLYPWAFILTKLFMDTLSEQYEAAESPDQPQIQRLIYEYLVYNCYGETARSFGADCRMIKTEDDSLDDDLMDMDKADDVITATLAHRRTLQDFILTGSITEAIAYCEDIFPHVIDACPDIIFSLKCQQFIQLVHQKNSFDAMEYAQTELGRFSNINKKYTDTLEEIVSLIAYPNPHQSPLAHHLSTSRLAEVANVVNESILQYYGLSRVTALETITRHATVLRDELHQDSLKDKKGPNQKVVFIKLRLYIQNGALNLLYEVNKRLLSFFATAFLW
jgi:hypothetical protein